MEKAFDFMKKLNQVHKPSRINYQKLNSFEGTKITNAWRLTTKPTATIVVKNAIKDLQEYFKVSMDTDVVIDTAETVAEKTIFAFVDTTLPERSFRIRVNDGIEIAGSDDKMVAQGCYALEDRMNLNEMPALEPCDEIRHIRFSPRSIWSCVGGSEKYAKYTDEHLRLIAHYGFTAVKVRTANAINDPKVCEYVNDVIKRAAAYGLDVYTFGSFKNLYHPQDEGAYEYYDSLYGKLFDLCPGLKGIQIVGECCEFPSHDTRTTGKSWRESLADDKPSPGWFPCNDYPQFISMLKDIIKKHAPEAEFVFWTYNWGYEKQELREELLRNVPEDVTLMSTFEMFEEVNVSPEVTEYTTDYTLWQIGPGKYFKTEAAIAKERNLRMIAMANTAGATWDIGGVPYLPTPQRWIERWKAVADAQDNLRLDGIEDSHTYGFWPSIITELSKYAYMIPMPDLNECLRQIIIRDYGENNVDEMLEIFELFSEGMSHCVSTNEDQYGPARVGPAYPLFFKEWELIPTGPESVRDVNFEAYPLYTYNLDYEKRLTYETKEYMTMAKMFDEGCRRLVLVASMLEGNKYDNTVELLQVAKFIANTARTIYHVKRWHYLKGKMGVYVDARPTWVGGRKNMADARKAKKPLVSAPNTEPIILELIDVLKREIANAEDTIPLVSANSRLGYEQEFDYACSPEQLRWKIAKAYDTLNNELLPLIK